MLAIAMTIEENLYLILHSKLARSTIRVREYEGRKCEHEHEFLTLKSRKKVSFRKAENGIKILLSLFDDLHRKAQTQSMRQKNR